MERITPLLRTGYLPLRLMHSLISNRFCWITQKKNILVILNRFKMLFACTLKRTISFKIFAKLYVSKTLRNLELTLMRFLSVMELPEKIKNYENSTYAKYKSPSWIYIQNKGPRVERKITMSLMDFGARLIPLQKGDKRPARKFANHDFTKDEINNFIRHGYNVGLLVQPKFIFIDIDTPENHKADGITNFG